MNMKIISGLIVLALAMSFLSGTYAAAEDNAGMASTYVTNGNEKVLFSYPKEYVMVNDGSCGTMVYIDDSNYVSVNMARNHQSGIETLQENVNDAKAIVVLTDDMNVVGIKSDDNHGMPFLSVVNVGIDLPDGNGLVISAFSEEGKTEVYPLLLSIVGSVVDPSPLAKWINEQWLTDTWQHDTKAEVEKRKSNAPYATMADRDGNIVIIGAGTVYVYHYANMKLLWQADFCGHEHSVSRNTDQKTISFVTKAGENYYVYHVNTKGQRLESYPISEQGIRRFHFVNDGVIYINEMNEVKKVCYGLQETRKLLFSENVKDVYDAVSDDGIDYIVHTVDRSGRRMICVSAFTKGNEHLFTTDLYSTDQAEPALCEAIVVDGNFVAAFHPRSSGEKYKPILWVSKEGKIIHSVQVKEKDCCISLRSDGQTEKLYTLININMDPTILMKTYDGNGQKMDEERIEKMYAFTSFFHFDGGWYLWNEDKTELLPCFR